MPNCESFFHNQNHLNSNYCVKPHSCINGNALNNQHNQSNNKEFGGYKDVVIIGNGPSGLCLSYFLSGHWPHWNKNTVSDEYLQMRLQYCDNGLSLVEQDLEYLSDGLEGRTNNPVSLLYDKLKHCDADSGMDLPSCLTWKYDPLKEIDHICIGKAPGAGGAWNDLDGSQLTISPSRWMELADFSYSEWKKQSSRADQVNAGLVFSAKNSNFSEDNSLLNANHFLKPSISNPRFLNNYARQTSSEETRVSMHDVKMYYRDFVKQKNLDRYLLNNATVSSVRRVYCNRLITPCSMEHQSCCSTTVVAASSASTLNQQQHSLPLYWEVTGLIDKRDRKKASSLTHKGDLMEFKFYCKHLVLANGTSDLHNELSVKGENLRFILRTIKELEDKIREDLARLQKEPLLIVGSGLSAADAILLAQKYSIKIVHVIRRSVLDANLIFNKLPKKIYPEYQRVYEQMIHNRYTNFTSECQSESNSNSNCLPGYYVLYDECQVKKFTSKRSVILTKLEKSENVGIKCSNQAKKNRHLTLQKQHHQTHQRQMKEFDEDAELSAEHSPNSSSADQSKSDIYFPNSVILKNKNSIELKISYACVLIGHSPNLDFLPPLIVNELALDARKPLNTKDNPIGVDKFTHEVLSCPNLYAMGPLIGDNFVRFGTGGALAITSTIFKHVKLERQKRLPSLNSISLPPMNTVLNQPTSRLNTDSNNNDSLSTSLNSATNSNAQTVLVTQ